MTRLGTHSARSELPLSASAVMGFLEGVKDTFEKVTGWARPSGRDLDAALQSRKANAFRFKDDGVIPNNPKLPFVLYRTPVRLTGKFDPAAVFEELFERNNWANSWRNGIYDSVHYHSRIHEVLGIARGHVLARFGGTKGRRLRLKAGDVVILPAGTGHERLAGSKDLLVVGAYPPFGTYDECRTSTKEHAASSDQPRRHSQCVRAVWDDAQSAKLLGNQYERCDDGRDWCLGASG